MKLKLYSCLAMALVASARKLQQAWPREPPTTPVPTEGITSLRAERMHLT